MSETVVRLGSSEVALGMGEWNAYPSDWLGSSEAGVLTYEATEPYRRRFGR